jgi:hypothetical protein
MKVLGTATVFAASTTKFKTTGQHAVYVFNTHTAAAVATVRNAADDDNIGTVYVAAGSGIVVHLADGQGLRGATTFYGTAIANAGY